MKTLLGDFEIIWEIMIYVQVGDRLSSLVTGSPPIWITKRSGWLYFRSPIKCLLVLILSPTDVGQTFPIPAKPVLWKEASS